MVDNLDYPDERSSQRDLEDDEPSSPAEVATTTSIHPPTMNGSAEPNHTKPSSVQFHKANKEAVPLGFSRQRRRIHLRANHGAAVVFQAQAPTGSAKITPTSKDDDKSYIKSLAKQPNIKRLKARRVLMHPTLDC
ncbi:hypothetical protein BFW01_g615 [Lasiodiplodia theobromae]|nr:hypothetical protein BFW01_g615 [Lasiodiplodia theobromae]